MANALHRKANRCDVDELLTVKADVADLKQLHSIIDQKADMPALDEVVRMT